MLSEINNKKYFLAKVNRNARVERYVLDPMHKLRIIHIQVYEHAWAFIFLEFEICFAALAYEAKHSFR